MDRLNIKFLRTRKALRALMAGSLLLASNSLFAAQCEYLVSDDWNTGFTAHIRITNDGESTLNGWQVSWQYDDDSKFTSGWNASFSGTGPYTADNLSWNASIAPGSFVEFGVQGDKGVANSPAAIATVSGAICDTTGGEPTSEVVWILEESSGVEFVTVKKEHVAEVQRFNEIEATVDKQGQAVMVVDLNSVMTNVDIRDERLRNILFETQWLPKVYFTLQLDLTEFDAMLPGSSKISNITGSFSLHGIRQSITAEVLVVKSADNRLNVSTFKPILIDSADFDLDGGVEALRVVANLSSIGRVVPVFLRLNLKSNTDPNVVPIALPEAPESPGTLSAIFADATSQVSLSWQDRSNNENGFLVRRKGADNFWKTAANLADDSSSFAEGLADTGEYSYKVIAYNGSIPSEPSNIAIVGVDEVDPVVMGEQMFVEQCQTCHGENAEGTLAGPALNTSRDVAVMIEYIRTNMPPNNPGSCDAECASQIADYIQTLWPPAEEQPAPRQLNLLSRYEYRNTVTDLLSLSVEQNLTENFPLEAIVNGYDNNAAKNVVTDRHLDEYLTAAAELAGLAVSQNKTLLLPNCTEQQSNCADLFIADFGQKAFRRPLNVAEEGDFKTLFDTESNFDEGMTLVIRAMLSSPHFLYKSEMGVVEGDQYRLTPYEVASQLAFMFWGSMPDADLLSAAGSNQLNSLSQLEAQARRLLQDPRARRHVGHFMEQWLLAGPQDIGNKDNQAYPQFSDEIRAAMSEELKAFTTNVVFDSTQLLNELFVADYVYVNDALDSYYNVAEVVGEDLQQVPDPSGRRGGILTLGAVMAAHGHEDETAPFPRGNFVRGRIMCHQLPPPPEELDTSFPEPDPNLTTRERFAARTDSPVCQACHQYLNGVGFSLEAFDGAGGFRTIDNNKPVDSSGELIGVEDLIDGASILFNGARELQSNLLSTENVKACFARQYYRFSRGYSETSNDQATLDNLYQQFRQSNFNIQQLMIGVTQLSTFTLRRQAEE